MKAYYTANTTFEWINIRNTSVFFGIMFIFTTRRCVGRYTLIAFEFKTLKFITK
jgi:hypothetical protein